LALELVGPHNCAHNSARVLGDAALKFRLLQARGYIVVPISCSDWRKLFKFGPEEQTWVTKMVYLQNRIERKLPADERWMLAQPAGYQLTKSP
jgi:hypothetical protein